LPKTTTRHALSVVLALLMIFPAFAAIYHPVTSGQVESPPLPLATGTKGGATFSDPIVSSTVVNQNTQFSLKWADSVRIMGYIFSFDSGSGTFVNDSLVAVNSTSVWTNATKPIYGTVGEKIRWEYYVEDNNSVWSKSYTYSFVAGLEPSAVSFANFRLMTDDSYDLLAYDGTNFANLGNFPQLVGTYGSQTGFHEVVWNPQATMAIAVGYNNSAILYTRTSGTVTVLSTGASPDTNLDGIAWMPNGTSAIITGTNPDVILTYSTEYRNFTLVQNPTGITGLGSVAWNPVSNYAIITGSNGLLKYSISGVLSIIPSAAGVSTSSIAFNPNGTIALLTGQGGNLFKYTSAQSNLTYIGTIPGVIQLQQVRFSRDGAYALISAKPGSSGDNLYRYDGANLYAVTTGTNSTATGISFSPDDSSAIVAVTGGLLTENYNSDSATQATLTPNSTVYGVDFLPPSIVTTTTATTTNASPNALALISINTNGTHSAGNPINISGRTLTSNGSSVPSQSIYIWVNGKVQGSATSNLTGYWSYSFTPSTNGTYYVAASQNQDGSGVTSRQLALSVSVATTTSTTTHSTTSSSTSNQTTTTRTSSGNSSTTTLTTTTTSNNRTTTTSNTTTILTTTKTNTTSVHTTTSTSNTTSNTSVLITSSTQISSSMNSSTTSSTTTNSTITQTSVTYTNSTTSQVSNAQQQTSWVALFTTIPYVTTSSPSAGGSAIFVCYLGIVVSIPFIVRKLRKRAQEGGSTHDWRW
jgi:hypothetical protein